MLLQSLDKVRAYNVALTFQYPRRVVCFCNTCIHARSLFYVECFTTLDGLCASAILALDAFESLSDMFQYPRRVVCFCNHVRAHGQCGYDNVSIPSTGCVLLQSTQIIEHEMSVSRFNTLDGLCASAIMFERMANAAMTTFQYPRRVVCFCNPHRSSSTR